LQRIRDSRIEVYSRGAFSSFVGQPLWAKKKPITRAAFSSALNEGYSLAFLAASFTCPARLSALPFAFVYLSFGPQLFISGDLPGRVFDRAFSFVGGASHVLSNAPVLRGRE
jgi:hypothetical protein